MISIIVCSINPELAEALDRNISSTIGVEYEMIVHDNRGSSMGLAAVYNMCAERAKYDYLCFAHEDIIFNTVGWGEIILAKLRQQDCGVIGFGGATIKSRGYSGWGQRKIYNRCNYIQHYKDKGREPQHCVGGGDRTADFDRVVTLDGLALFTSRRVWAECRFDDELLRAFHGYDLDFTLQSHFRGYHNYVCNTISVEHLSCGSYNDMWIEESINLHDKKWGDKLPMMVGELSAKEIERNERVVDYVTTKAMVKGSSDKEFRRKMLSRFLKRYGLLNGAFDIIVKYLKAPR